MNITLKIPKITFGDVKVRLREYDVELDDFRSVLMDIGSILPDNTIFHIEDDFGNRINLFPSIDVPIFLEQMPDVLDLLKTRSDFEIMFYEQHNMFNIKFTYMNSFYFSSIFYMNNDSARLDLGVKSHSSLQENFFSIIQSFNSFSNDFICNIRKQCLYNEWYESVSKYEK